MGSNQGGWESQIRGGFLYLSFYTFSVLNSMNMLPLGKGTGWLKQGVRDTGFGIHHLFVPFEFGDCSTMFILMIDKVNKIKLKQ